MQGSKMREIKSGQLRVWWTNEKLFLVLEELSVMPTDAWRRYRVLQEGKVFSVTEAEITDKSVLVESADD